jgi:hypothetical protein
MITFAIDNYIVKKNCYMVKRDTVRNDSPVRPTMDRSKRETKAKSACK